MALPGPQKTPMSKVSGIDWREGPGVGAGYNSRPRRSGGIGRRSGLKIRRR